MKVNVQVDALVLDGVELSRRERDLLPTAIERELGRLVVRSGTPQEAREARTHPRVDALASQIAVEVSRSLPPTRRVGLAPDNRAPGIRSTPGMGR